jgi:peptidoglycan hydrolase-like protein with peptidoglycan-binding domain
MTGEDVKALQIYLNTHGYILTLSGNGSPNNETTYFGHRTELAVMKFQKANNLKPDGVVGPITRSFIK